MAAEENLHIYQNLYGGKTITYKPKPGHESSNDDEIDIAATFAAHKLPITEDFLNRYTGRREHAQDSEVWDLVAGHNGEIQRVQVGHKKPQSELPPNNIPASLANLFAL